ncbi:MAG TPA: archease [Nocardioidaceae bacterium]
MDRPASGHRVLPHTADIRVEAWAPTRERCVAEAVRGTVETFADLGDAAPEAVRRRSVLVAATDEDLLVAALDEMVYLMDTTGELPVDTELVATGEGAEIRFSMVRSDRLVQVGAVPKAVSLHGLRLSRDGDGWSCSVTLDV